jgi:hypothetical protein
MWLGSCLSRHLPQQRAGEAGGQHKASGTLGGEGPRVQDLQAAVPPLQQPSARDLFYQLNRLPAPLLHRFYQARRVVRRVQGSQVDEAISHLVGW